MKVWRCDTDKPCVKFCESNENHLCGIKYRDRNKYMNVLSLFDGMSCGRIALGRAGIDVDNYYSAEIDKYAVKIADKNYPQDSDKRLGDVTKWRDWNIDWSNIDLVTGGFPCQSWSVAGKGLGDRDERGMLFWTMLDIMKKVLEHNPKAKFLMENVRMKKEFEDYITEHTEKALGTVHKHLINSSLVSAQNRKRFYWTNIEGIEQPEDKGILLRDILDYSIEDTHIKPSVYKNILEQEEEIKAGKNGFHQLRCTSGFQDNKIGVTKSPTLRAGNSCTYVQVRPRKPKVLLNETNIRFMNRMYGQDTRWRKFKNPIDGKSGCVVATLSKGLPRGIICTDIELQEKIYKDGTCDMEDFKNNQASYRKLTPLECERLQTVPNNYTEGVSNTQRYKMLGNGWTVDVIAHIFKGIK